MDCSVPYESVANLAVIRTGKSNKVDAVEQGAYAFFDRSPIVKRSERYLFDGEAVIVPGEGKEFLPRYFRGKFDLHQRAYALFPASSIDGKFLYYAILAHRSHLSKVAVGSTVKSLRLSSFESMLIPLPDMRTQQAIGGFLSLLDEKVELNSRINGYLGELVDALFKREFLESIDKSWIEATLLDIANYRNGLAMQKFRPEGSDLGLPVLKIRELSQGRCAADAERCRSDIDESVHVHDGDLIFSWSGTLLLDFWTGGDAGLNQHLFKVTSDKYDPWFYCLWTKYHMHKFVALAKDRATTMGHIKRSALADSRVFVPNANRMRELKAIFEPLVDQMISVKVESRKLEELRDALLPKLISGEVNVSNVSLERLNSHLFGC